MEHLRQCIDELHESDGIVKSSTIYKVLANFNLSSDDRKEFKEEIIPQIHRLYENGKIRKDVLFISLLVNPSILEILLEYEAAVVKLDLRKPKSLFDYVYYKKKHWILEIIESLDQHTYFTEDIRTLLLVLRIVFITNLNSVNTAELSDHLDRNYDSIDPFFKVYIENTNLVSQAVKFIKTNAALNDTDIFQSLSQYNLLNGISDLIDITNPLIWEQVTNLLKENETFNSQYFNRSMDESNYTEEEVFTAFTILISIINCLKLSKNISKNSPKTDDITATLEMIKEKLINLKNKMLQIELLENIFVLIFLRTCDFEFCETDSFFCGEYEIRLILSLLKSVFEELKKLYSSRVFTEFKRFVELNKQITDGYWRLELLNSIKRNWYSEDENHEKTKNILRYMLSSPEGLINMCLKQNNIEKAIQVVKIFGLEESSLANEIEYSIAIENLRKNLVSQKEKSWINIRPSSVIDNHMSSCKSNPSLHTKIDFLSQKAIDTFDMLLTLPLDYSAFRELTDIIDAESDDIILPPFYHRMKQMNCDNYYPSSEVLLSCNSVDLTKFDKEFSQYAKLLQAYNTFQTSFNRLDNGVLNFSHPLHKLFIELQEISIGFQFNNTEQVQYMQKLLKYLRAFSKIFLLEQNNTDLISKGYDTSLLEVLKHKRVDLISKLINERQVDGVDFDYIFGKMKLNMMYHIAASSFPKVNLNRTNANWTNTQLYKPRKDVVNYIQKRDWLLAFMINKIHSIRDEKIDSNEVRIRTLGNLMQLKDVQNLKELFNNSEILTVLQYDFCTYMTNEDGTPSYNESFYPILLKLPETGDWKRLYDLISSINETRIDSNIGKLRDMILCNLVKSRQESDYYKYIRFISNREIRLQIILEEIHFWPADFCIDIITFETSICGDGDKISDLQNWRKKIELYTQMKDVFDSVAWFDVNELCENAQEEVLNKILKVHDIDIVINYLDIHHVKDNLLVNIPSDYFISIFNLRCPQLKIKKLLEKLPPEHFLSTCNSLLKSLKTLEDLEFILTCLKENSNKDELNLQNVEISLKIMRHFTPDEQQQFYCLMGDPISILEMLLMNTKLEKLGQILQGIQIDIKAVEEDESIISVEKIDGLLRTYAEKSVDFKIIVQTAPSSTSESKIMQSIDSLSLEPKIFDMPDKVPTKEEWISDDNVTECMCCYQITFSMFNRRHHCRRCGRVICWNCSLQKMLVDTYGDILVRVCKDCYKKSHGISSDSDSLKSDHSRIDDFWILTDNPDHNAILRDEFSYENAPSVLLCLSILKYHSKTDLCPRFLLNQCENILQILHPIGAYYETEIDFNLIINMLKSLAVAAKMISNQCVLQWGASLADKMISQAEMLGLLAEKGYLHLLSSRSQNVHIDANVLRHVRDKLLEFEQWHLALEVSTKVGLDTAGVFAKWGKSFLKAGNLQSARLKFHMCFEKCSQYEAPDYSNLYESSSSLRGSSRSLHQSKLSLNLPVKPQKSPLLLNEIIQILESKTEKINMKVFKNIASTKSLYDSTTSLQSNPNMPVRSEDSVSIINKLQSLSAIANGNYILSDNGGDCERTCGPHLENIYYDECVYYLEKYGSHASLCQFYIRHDDFRQALEYIIENEVNTDIFIDVYMTCLKDGRINRLQEVMLIMDSTLDTWKNYIRHICIFLEKQSMLHSLYQLQQFIGDFVRASMTCIKFYSHDVSSFEEFRNRIEYLQNAHDHLKQELEQEQWVDVQSVHSFQSQDTFEEKSISNPALVMKMNSKEINKHINTVTLQIEVVEFLTVCENSGKSMRDVLVDIQLPTNPANLPVDSPRLPTLFGSIYEKMQLAILCVVAGENVEDGFGIAYRIIHDYKLKATKIYCQSGRLLAKAKRHSSVPALVKCIRSGGEKDSVLTEMCDEMLALTARTLGDINATDKQLEDIIKHISNRTIKINSYIETKQLRSAFLLAAKFSRIGDIRRISREAELYNRPDVKKLCQKYLQIQEHGGTSKNEIS